MSVHPANRLINEKSPYLLQHAYNPVDWFPWSEEAFRKAQNENKPVFLSIGYSTCHWCHVMERESFESEAIAKILNDHFVAIKVDREERPDLDSVFMSVVQALTGHGGWPMSVFLTPDKKPFFGGTYFPPQAKWGSPGFGELLFSIQQNWKMQENKIRESSEAIVVALQERTQAVDKAAPMPTAKFSEEAYRELKENFDAQFGGFGHAPKFPMGHTLGFLLRYATFAKVPQSLAMVEQTLRAMALGGIHDHLGGGFHRYSTDARWQVPHFEKMLYDQALLSKSYLEAYQATGQEKYAQVARQTFDYVLKDLSDPLGGFYSAEDADSYSEDPSASQEKKEGAFYVWSQSQLKQLLTDEEYTLMSQWFGIEENGNAQNDPHGEFTGKNILHAEQSLESVAKICSWSVPHAQEVWQKTKVKLNDCRIKRSRPHRDEKVLTDWNSLMISSLMMAARVLNEDRYLKAGRQALDFILKTLVRSDGRLLHRYGFGEAGILGGLEDYAFLIQALLDSFEYTFDAEYLKHAQYFTAEMERLFLDARTQSYFLTPEDGEDLFLRPREVYDGAIPSGNSVAALNHIRLYYLTGEEKYFKAAEAIFTAFGHEVARRPSAYCQFLMGTQFFIGPVKQITFHGDPLKPAHAEMLQYLFRSWIPCRTLKVNGLNLNSQSEHIVICENHVCQRPVDSLETLKTIL